MNLCWVSFQIQRSRYFFEMWHIRNVIGFVYNYNISLSGLGQWIHKTHNSHRRIRAGDLWSLSCSCVTYLQYCLCFTCRFGYEGLFVLVKDNHLGLYVQSSSIGIGRTVPRFRIDFFMSYYFQDLGVFHVCFASLNYTCCTYCWCPAWCCTEAIHAKKEHLFLTHLLLFSV